jgi:hypothetical protein
MGHMSQLLQRWALLQALLLLHCYRNFCGVHLRSAATWDGVKPPLLGSDMWAHVDELEFSKCTS